VCPLEIKKYIGEQVNKAMHDHAWVADIRNALGLRGLTEYLELWNLSSRVNLNDLEDLDRWRLEAQLFSTRSAYITFEL